MSAQPAVASAAAVLLRNLWMHHLVTVEYWSPCLFVFGCSSVFSRASQHQSSDSELARLRSSMLHQLEILGGLWTASVRLSQNGLGCSQGIASRASNETWNSILVCRCDYHTFFWTLFLSGMDSSFHSSCHLQFAWIAVKWGSWLETSSCLIELSSPKWFHCLLEISWDFSLGFQLIWHFSNVSVSSWPLFAKSCLEFLDIRYRCWG